MKFGLTTDEFEYINKNVVQPLLAKGAKVYCYGSRARGDHTKFSDLDLMVEVDSKAELNLSAINDLVRESAFPYKLDIVDFAEFAESYKPGYQRDKRPYV